MTSKRPRRSTTKIPPPEEKGGVQKTHKPKITKKSIKAITTTSASCKSNFRSRKVRNVLVQHKEETVIVQRPTPDPKALSSEDAVLMAIKHLKECDLKLGSIIEMHDTPKFQKCQSAFQSLVRTIVCQQLAPKAADSIHHRLVSLCEVQCNWAAWEDMSLLLLWHHYSLRHGLTIPNSSLWWNQISQANSLPFAVQLEYRGHSFANRGIIPVKGIWDPRTYNWLVWHLGETGVIPETISKLSVAEMRNVGISERKASYLHDLASNFMSGVLSDSLIFEMDDDSLISSLTAVKGIGGL
ncbi:hypothetical protein KI387_021169, partial [Taxus chinensis]